MSKYGIFVHTPLTGLIYCPPAKKSKKTSSKRRKK